MTIAKTGSENSYAGDGVSVNFAFQFRFFADTDLDVYIVAADGTSTLQTLTTDYSVTNTGTEAGGTVTMVTAPATGETLLIQRDVPQTQSVDYQNNDAFPAETHEQALDRLTLLVQQQSRGDGLHLTLPTGDTASPIIPTVPNRATKLLGFGSTGEIEVYETTTGIDATLFDDFDDLKADTNSFSVGSILRTKIGAFAYEVADPSATDNQVVTAGGAKLYARPKDGPFYASQIHSFDTTGATDEIANVQGAYDFASANGKRHLIFPEGTLLIDGTLKFGVLGGFDSVHVQGANGSFLGQTTFKHASGQLINPLINIRGARMLRMSDIKLQGNNLAPSLINSGSHRSTDLADYTSAGISDGRYNPYAGIAFSALFGSDPGGGNNYTFGSYGESDLASKCFFERIRIDGFFAAAVIGPNAGSTGLEDFMFRDCTVVENAYGICTTSTQQRNVVVENMNIQGNFSCFDNITFGDQTGNPIYVKTSNIGKSAFVDTPSTATGAKTMRDCYFESIRSVMSPASGGSGRHRQLYSGCNMSLIGHDEDGTETQKDTPIRNETPLTLESGSIVAQNLFNVAPQQRLVLRDYDFRVENSASETVFGIWPSQGNEENVFLEGCDMRSYTGPTRYLNNVQEVDGIDSRARVELNCQEVLDRTTGTRYWVDRHPVPFRGPVISNLTYDSADSLSFDYTVAADRPILEDDLLYWRVWTPQGSDSTGPTVFLPALKITNISGIRVTCDILAHIDTSYSPGSVDAVVLNFVNSDIATGDTLSGNADITNVTNISNFAIGDWLITNDGDLPTQLQIINIAGSTITCHRTLNRTNTGIQLWNAKLLPHGVKADAFVTYDPPSLADGAGVTTTVKCRGAELGDDASASFSLDLQGITVTAWVSAANVVSVRFQNESGGVLDLASGTLKVTVKE